MAGILERIFPVASHLDCLENYCRSQFSSVPSTLIIGPTNTMKTTMLIQAAVTEGTADGRVLFIAPKQVSDLPLSIHGMPQPSSLIMKKLKFLYATHPQELQSYLASVHLEVSTEFPSLIVVDDLQKYVASDNSGDVAQIMVNIAKIISLIQDVGEYYNNSLTNASQSTSSGTNSHHCSILMAWTSCNSDLLKHTELESFASDYCQHVWTVKQQNNKGGSCSSKYKMVERLQNASCTLSFDVRRKSYVIQEIIMDQVELEVEDAAENTEAALQTS